MHGTRELEHHRIARPACAAGYILAMDKRRLEAFSDGVVAILITIMVLELKVPHAPTWEALAELRPVFLAYVLSFINLGIYWNNHHHLIYATRRINGAVLWANLHLLFWLSLMPFATAWMGENHFATVPTAMYGVDLLACGVAYTILVRTIIAQEGPDSKLASAVGVDVKGVLSLVLYVLSIPLAFVRTYIAGAIFVFVALMWLVPDRRIERRVVEEPSPGAAHAVKHEAQKAHDRRDTEHPSDRHTR
jgi:uncharacterized membrane protein